MYNRKNIDRLNIFLDKYATKLEEQGKFLKAVEVRMLTVPTLWIKN